VVGFKIGYGFTGTSVLDSVFLTDNYRFVPENSATTLDPGVED
jgi:hypothetical protein